MAFPIYIARRLLIAIPTILGVCTIVFFLSHAIPGDPVDFIMGEDATSSLDRQKLTQQLGLDKPIHIQYFEYLKNLGRGHLGYSYQSPGKTVQSLILERLPATCHLALTSLLFALFFSIPLGIFAAIHSYTWIDTLAMMIALLGISIPHFALGPALISILAIWLNLSLPFYGDEHFLSFVLPTITLGTALMAILTRMTRASMLEVLHKEYIRTAVAKGLNQKIILFKHALRNALNPIITIVGLQLGALLTGAIITETIFSWPGLGHLFVSAIQQRDFLVIQGCVLFIALSYIVVNLITDLLYSVADPRIRLQ